jgi:hypothetical protein
VLARHSWPEAARGFLALYREILRERNPAGGVQTQPRIQ